MIRSPPKPSESNLDFFNITYVIWFCFPSHPLFLPSPVLALCTRPSKPHGVLEIPNTFSCLHVLAYAALFVCIICPSWVYCEISTLLLFCKTLSHHCLWQMGPVDYCFLCHSTVLWTWICYALFHSFKDICLSLPLHCEMKRYILFTHFLFIWLTKYLV